MSAAPAIPGAANQRRCGSLRRHFATTNFVRRRTNDFPAHWRFSNLHARTTSRRSVLPASGSIRWYRNLPNDILAAPALSEGIAYVGCKDANGDGGLLYALKDNGREHWKKPVKLPYAPAGAPIVSGEVIYVPGQRGTLMGIDKAEGGLGIADGVNGK